jgi:predicted branched-subunit amino acid permease
MKPLLIGWAYPSVITIELTTTGPPVTIDVVLMIAVVPVVPLVVLMAAAVVVVLLAAVLTQVRQVQPVLLYLNTEV